MASFGVTANKKSDCPKKDIKGQLTLCVQSGHVSVSGKDDFKRKVCWNLEDFREYGHTKQSVFFITGSRSCTGVGRFDFLTSEGERIVEAVKAEAMKLQDDPTPPPPSANVYNNQPNGKPLPPTKPKLSASSQQSEKDHSPTLDHKVGKESFMQELSVTLSHGSDDHGSSHAPLGRSGSTESSKAEKKKAKELEKERKKREKEEEKERKKKEKLLKEENKKEQMKLKKTKSKAEEAPPPAPEMDLYNDIDDAYAVANEFPRQSVAPPLKPKPKLESDGQIYNDPWENKALPGVPPSPVSPNRPEYDDAMENIYAQPAKKNSGTKAPAVGGDAYEDVGENTAPSSHVPPPVPPKTFLEDEDEPNNNVYDHFAGNQEEDVHGDHIYGMNSASAPFTPQGGVYEDTAYEVSDIQAPQPVPAPSDIYETI